LHIAGAITTFAVNYKELAAASHISTKKSRSLKLIAALLLLLYVAAIIQPHGFHELLHEQTTARIHTPELEADPCHQKLFHHSQKEGCQHQFHFTSVKKCSLCHTATITAHALTVSTLSQAPASVDDYPAPGVAEEPVSLTFLLPSRAPPIV
jgi:hypothetical protein